MSAIKTIIWEAAPGAEEDEGEEMDLDPTSDSDSEEQYDEEDEYDESHGLEQDDQEGYDRYEESNANTVDRSYAFDNGDRQNQYSVPAKRKQKQKEDKVPGARVLPVADLPDDFDGEAMDGATYLALANRSNALLPRSVRVPPPNFSGSTQDQAMNQPIATEQQQPIASSSRHPALPAESWTTVFPIHFKAYRQHIRTEWPPSPPVPYPAHMADRPRAHLRGEVWQYIHGCRRKFREVQRSPNHKGKGKGRQAALEDDEEAMMNGMASRTEEDDDDAAWGIDPRDRVDVENDGELDEEEEAMNNGRLSNGAKELEEETDRHRPHEPLISVLQLYTSGELISIIDLITTFITETLDRLSPFVLVRSTSETSINPFPELYMRWLFACLILLDDQLDGDSMSSVRDLARAVMKVAAWRWIRAVTDGEVTADHRASQDGEEAVSWTFGQAVPATAAAAAKDQPRENGLEETLGRCWVIFHAVVAGWGQRDLLDDLDHMFR